MIIERIKVENFATYRRAELDLNKLGPTISVFGSTGAGKTTFFVDAVTLALYGRAYGQAKKEYAKHVIPSWALKSRVEIEFRVPTGSKYRVIRVLQREGSSSAVLYKLSDDGNIERTIATGVSAVESEIEKLVGLDFKTFMNTIVVRQGRVAELISRDITPSDRRKLFLKAFDIDFTKHKEVARELYIKTKSELEKLKSEIEKINEEISVEEDLKLKAVELEAQLKEINIKFRKLSDERKQLGERVEEVQRELTDVERRLASLDQLSKTLTAYREEFMRISKDLEELGSLLSQRKELERKHSLLSRQMQILEEMFELERNAEIIRERIFQLKQLTSKRDFLQKELADAQRELEIVKEELERLEAEAKKCDELSDELSRIEMEISKLTGYSGFIEKSISALKENLGDEVTCPVCSTKLSRERAGEAIRHLSEELATISSKVKSLEGEKRAIALKIEKLKLSKEKLRYAEKMASRLAAKIEQLNRQVKELDAYVKELSDEEAKLSDVMSRFSKLSSQFMLMFGVLIKIGEARGALNVLKEKLEQLSRKLMEVREAAGRIDELKRRKIELEALIAQLESKLDEYPSLRELKGKLDLELKRVKSKIEEVDSLIVEMSNRKARVEEQLKLIVDSLREIENKRRKLKELQSKSLELERKVNVYLYLYQYVFHEKGLPLALLKRYLERVEEWADHYVSRFLPGKSIRIEALEDAVSIIVYDGATIRDLTTYSGGEMVLLGFAIRLGIARALAEKAGVAPRFLIIDEGFGPLSREFRSELLRTLNELQKDYERIIVISHVDEVRDSPYFESQIHIYKDESGVSRVEVLK